MGLSIVTQDEFDSLTQRVTKLETAVQALDATSTFPGAPSTATGPASTGSSPTTTPPAAEPPASVPADPAPPSSAGSDHTGITPPANPTPTPPTQPAGQPSSPFGLPQTITIDGKSIDVSKWLFALPTWMQPAPAPTDLQCGVGKQYPTLQAAADALPDTGGTIAVHDLGPTPKGVHLRAGITGRVVFYAAEPFTIDLQNGYDPTYGDQSKTVPNPPGHRITQAEDLLPDYQHGAKAFFLLDSPAEIYGFKFYRIGPESQASGLSVIRIQNGPWMQEAVQRPFIVEGNSFDWCQQGVTNNYDCTPVVVLSKNKFGATWPNGTCENAGAHNYYANAGHWLTIDNELHDCLTGNASKSRAHWLISIRDYYGGGRRGVQVGQYGGASDYFGTTDGKRADIPSARNALYLDCTFEIASLSPNYYLLGYAFEADHVDEADPSGNLGVVLAGATRLAGTNTLGNKRIENRRSASQILIADTVTVEGQPVTLIGPGISAPSAPGFQVG